MVRKTIRWILLAAFVLLVVAAIFVFSRHPSNDRDWTDEYSKAATVEIAPNGSMTLHNVRDWVYGSSTVEKQEWTEITIDPKNIMSAWYFVDYFSSVHALAHTFLSFTFSDGTALAFSIEARKEKGEVYSLIGGLTRKFELQYIWGTERDLVANSLFYYHEPVDMYHLHLSAEEARLLFTSLVSETNAIATTPRFYNLLTANCTNLLAKIVNKYYPDTLPYDVSWNLPGLSVDYLVREGYIQTEKNARINITAHVDELLPFASGPSRAFSAKLHSL